MNSRYKLSPSIADTIFNNMYEDFIADFEENKMELYYNLPIRLQSLKEADPIPQQEFLKNLTTSN
jgi:ribosomal protein S17E